MGEEGLQLFGGDWTEQKLDAVAKYLTAYLKVLKKQKHFHIAYVDAFAGTGYRERKLAQQDVGNIFGNDDNLADEEPQKFLAGSASMALQINPGFHRYVFVELSPRRAAELEKLKAKFPQKASLIDIRCGEGQRHGPGPVPLVGQSPGPRRSLSRSVRHATRVGDR